MLRCVSLFTSLWSEVLNMGKTCPDNFTLVSFKYVNNLPYYYGTRMLPKVEQDYGWWCTLDLSSTLGPRTAPLSRQCGQSGLPKYSGQYIIQVVCFRDKKDICENAICIMFVDTIYTYSVDIWMVITYV